MRKSNDCSKPAPRSSAAKQWLERTGSNDEDIPDRLSGNRECRGAGERGHDGSMSLLPFQKGSKRVDVLFHSSKAISCFIKIDLKQTYCICSLTKKIPNGFL